MPYRLCPSLEGLRRDPRRSCIALEDTFGLGRYREGLLFSLGLVLKALGTYSTSLKLPRADDLAI